MFSLLNLAYHLSISNDYLSMIFGFVQIKFVGSSVVSYIIAGVTQNLSQNASVVNF